MIFTFILIFLNSVWKSYTQILDLLLPILHSFHPNNPGSNIFTFSKSQLGPLTIIPPGKRVSPLSPSFISETSLAVSPRFNWRQLEQQVIFLAIFLLLFYESIEDISQARCLFLNSNSSSSSSNARKVCLCYFQLRLSVQVHATCLRRTLV